MQYRREVDGLRAVAVVPVILFHAGVAAFKGGFVGVDVFFVISGYLITTIIVVEVEAGTFSVARFYERRARRIMPALFAVMATSVAVAWLWLAPNEMSEFAQSLVSVVLFVSNFFFWIKADYFGIGAELKPMLHTWSLAVEEQYYVVFPPLLAWMFGFGRRAIVAAFVVCGLISLVLAQHWSVTNPGASFFLLPTRIWELLIGATCAMLLTSESSLARLRATGAFFRESLAGLGLTALLASIFVLDSTLPLPGFYSLLPTLGTAAIILFGDERTYTGRLLGQRLLVGIGLVSYSLYLWHQPILAFARNRSAGELHAPLLAGAFAVTALLGWLTWRFIEAPFRDRRRVRTRPLIVGGVATAAAFVAFGLAGRTSGGFKDMRTGERQARLLATIQSSPKRTACHVTRKNVLAPADACEYLAADVRWAVLGDSHGGELAYALALQLQKSGIGVKQFTSTGCYPAYGRTDDPSSCARWTADAVDYVMNASRLETVVVTYRIDSYLYGNHDATFPRLPNEVDERERDARWSSYVGLARDLQQHGKRVILVLQAPEASRTIEDLIFKYGAGGGDIVGVDRVWWDRRNAFVEAHRAEIPPGILVIDPTDLLCDRNACYVTRDGVALYFDDNHLGLPGAAIVASEILRDLALDGAKRLGPPIATHKDHG